MNVFFKGVLQAPAAGETGTLTVSADEHDWSGSAEVVIEKEGENYAEAEVGQLQCWLQVYLMYSITKPEHPEF